MMNRGPRPSETLTERRLEAMDYLYERVGRGGITTLPARYANALVMLSGGYVSQGHGANQSTWGLTRKGVETVEALRVWRREVAREGVRGR